MLLRFVAATSKTLIRVRKIDCDWYILQMMGKEIRWGRFYFSNVDKISVFINDVTCFCFYWLFAWFKNWKSGNENPEIKKGCIGNLGREDVGLGKNLTSINLLSIVSFLFLLALLFLCFDYYVKNLWKILFEKVRCSEKYFFPCLINEILSFCFLWGGEM